MLGWFVVEEARPASDPEPDARARDARTTTTTATTRANIELDAEVPILPAGKSVDEPLLAKVYRAAKISDEGQARVKKAQALLDSLPAETPNSIKRTIVEASLEAFNVPVDQIVDAAVEQVAALDAYVEHGARHTESVLTDARARIAKLESEIVEIRKLMDLQTSSQRTLAASCQNEKQKVARVLEFFSSTSTTSS